MNHPNVEAYTDRATYFRACSAYWYHIACEWDQRADAINFAPDIKAWMRGRADHFRAWARQDAEQALDVEMRERSKTRGLLQRMGLLA